MFFTGVVEQSQYILTSVYNHCTIMRSENIDNGSCIVRECEHNKKTL